MLLPPFKCLNWLANFAYFYARIEKCRNRWIDSINHFQHRWRSVRKRNIPIVLPADDNIHHRNIDHFHFPKLVFVGANDHWISQLNENVPDTGCGRFHYLFLLAAMTTIRSMHLHSTEWTKSHVMIKIPGPTQNDMRIKWISSKRYLFR